MGEKFNNHVNTLFKSMPTEEVDGQTLDLLHAAIGISGEGGEILDTVKKHVFYSQPIDMQNLVEELGDTLFYVHALASVLNIDMKVIEEHNINKLKHRYPDGKYSDEHATSRFDKQLEIFLDAGEKVGE